MLSKERKKRELDQDVESHKKMCCQVENDFKIDINYFLSKNDLLSNQEKKDALEYFERTAFEKKDGCAEVNAGLCHFVGIGTEVNFKRAFEHFQKASEYENIGGIINVGLCLCEGLGVESNPQLGFEYLTKAARLNTDAIFHVGICYLNGIGVEKDTTKGLEYLEYAANRANLYAIHLLISLYRSNEYQNYQKAYYFCMLGVKLDDGLSYSDLGSLYIKGLGVEVNPKLAIDYWNKAATKNNLCSLFYLAKYYLHNEEKTQEQGVRYLQEILKNKKSLPSRRYQLYYFAQDHKMQSWSNLENHPRTIDFIYYQTYCKLAECYMKGEGVSINFDLAMNLLQEASISLIFPQNLSILYAHFCHWFAAHPSLQNRNYEKSLYYFQLFKNQMYPENKDYMEKLEKKLFQKRNNVEQTLKVQQNQFKNSLLNLQDSPN